MGKLFKNLDDAEGVFFQREVEYVKARSYDIKFPELKARMLFPVSFEAGNWAETINYQQYHNKGKAKIINHYGKDLPRADVAGKEFVGPVRSIGASYAWTIQELRLSIKTGKALPQRRANAAKKACMTTENDIAFFGDANHGLNGLNVDTSIPEVTLPNDGTGSKINWSLKTPDLIIRDINLLFNGVVSQSLGVETADTLVLPIEQYSLLATKQRSTASDITILKWIMQNIPQIKNIEWVNEMKAIRVGGAISNGSADGIFAYKRDPEKMTLEVPQEFEQFPVQETGLEFEVPCHMRNGGLKIYYPLSIAKAYGL